METQTYASPAADPHNKKGLKIFLYILTTTLLVAAVGFGVYYWQQTKIDELNTRVQNLENTATQPPAAPGPTPQSKVPAGFTEYKNTELGFSFAYPQDWSKMLGFKDSIVTLRSAASQAAINKIEQDQIKMQAEVSTNELRVIKASSDLAKELESLVTQHTQNLQCPAEIDESTATVCRGTYRLLGTKQIDGVTVYEAIEGGFGSNYALVFKNKGTFIVMSFATTETKQKLTAELKQLVETLHFTH